MKWLILTVLLGAGIWDLRYRRVPNLLNYGLIIAGLVSHAFSGDFPSALIGLGVGMAWLLVPYLMGGIGAGDVKLLGAACCWAGWPDALDLALDASIAGGILVMVLAFGRKERRDLWLSVAGGGPGLARCFLRTLRDRRGERVPYALAIFLGYLLCFLTGV